MSLMAKAFQPLIRRGFFAINGRLGFTGLADAIMAPGMGFDMTFDPSNKRLSLDFRDDYNATLGLAADCCRFSAACFQSISSIENDILDRDKVAWCLIRLYYAAFYAAHAVMRLLGEARSYFDSQHIHKLVALAGAQGISPSITLRQGLYRCFLTNGDTVLQCDMAKRTDRASAGMHEMFWDNFATIIKTSADDILSGTLPVQDTQAVVMQLEMLRTRLRKDGAYRRLSAFRNDLQYKHLFDLWFPNSPKKHDKLTLRALIAEWNQDPMGIHLDRHRTETEGFVTCCTFVISLCHALLHHVVARSIAGKRCFVSLGPMVFLKDRLLV